jgi:DNA-binding PadR family transcriptional regulator
MEVRLGRKEVFANKFAVVDMLERVKEMGMGESRYLTLKLVEMGFVKAEDIKGEGRGRPRKVYVLTGKGRGRIGLAKNWKRPA